MSLSRPTLPASSLRLATGTATVRLHDPTILVHGLRGRTICSRLALAGCVVLGLVGCASHAASSSSTTAQTESEPLAVDVLTVSPQPWQTTVRSQGSLIADEVVQVGAKVAGRVASVAVDVGDYVHQGDVLVRLEDEEFRLLVAQAEAQLAQACAAIGATPHTPLDQIDKTQSPPVRQELALLREAQANHARALQLQQQQAITAAEIETIQAALAVAEARYASALNAVEEKLALIGVRRAELAIAKENLEHAAILAPFDGLIQARHVAPGAFVRAGDAVATLVRTDPLRYRGVVSERQALRVQTGQQVFVSIEGEPQPMGARISRVSPALDEASRTLAFEADLPNPQGRLRTGLFAEAEVIVDPHAQTLAVPASAIIEFAGVEKVWLVKDGQAVEQPVQAGRRQSGWVEIVQGLSSGDTILRQAAVGRTGPVVARRQDIAVGAE
jgi:RND family efflux transporter MFP subunit